MSRIASAAERLGGFVVLPRSTIRRFLAEPGGFAEDLIPWLLLAGAAASPERLGGAILLLRVAPGPGVGAILQAIFAKLDRLGAELPADAPGDLRHYLQRKSYEKAKLLLLGRLP